MIEETMRQPIETPASQARPSSREVVSGGAMVDLPPRPSNKRGVDAAHTMVLALVLLLALRTVR